MVNLIYILPELFLSISLLFLLMIGVFIKKSFKLVNFLTIIILIFSAAIVINQSGHVITIFNGSFIVDPFSNFMKILTLLACSFVLLSSKNRIV